MAARIGVVGGGISGLSAAYRLLQSMPDAEVTLFEGSPRLGGVIDSQVHQGVLCEHGPDSMLRKPAALALIRELGLEPEILETRSQARRALILSGSHLVPVPDGFYLLAPGRLWPFLRSRLISPLGKLRMACDLFLPARAEDAPEESLAGFVRRRLGRECLERIAQPLIAGITTADPEQLSLAAVFPQLLEMERRHRSLLMAMRERARETPASGARYGLFMTFNGGMSRLIERLGERLCAERQRLRMELECPVTAISRTPAGGGSAYSLTTAQGQWQGSHVVLALPAPLISRLTAGIDPELSDLAAGIPYADVATVNLVYARAAGALPEAAGYVVPAIQRRQVIAATFVDRKFDHRVPADRLLIRAFIGGALNPQALRADDAELSAVACREIASLLGLTGAPLWSVVTRHPRSMPQYILGHHARWQRIRQRLAGIPGLALLGNGFEGMGIGDLCAASERLAAQWRAQA